MKNKNGKFEYSKVPNIYIQQWCSFDEKMIAQLKKKLVLSFSFLPQNLQKLAHFLVTFENPRVRRTKNDYTEQCCNGDSWLKSVPSVLLIHKQIPETLKSEEKTRPLQLRQWVQVSLPQDCFYCVAFHTEWIDDGASERHPLNSQLSKDPNLCSSFHPSDPLS